MRLGLDIGTNSIGWWLYKTNSEDEVISHLDGGVRLYGDGRNPKSGESLAVARRMARQARKRRDRYLRRRSDLMKSLADAGLMPADPAERKSLEMRDPYSLRANGIDRGREGGFLLWKRCERQEQVCRAAARNNGRLFS